MKRRSRANNGLPSRLFAFFWNTDAGALDLVRDRDFICARLLREGGLAEVRFLRLQYGDAAVRRWIIRHEARGMSPARIRFWQLILKIHEREVSAWLRRARRGAGYQQWLKSRRQRPTAETIRVTEVTPY